MELAATLANTAFLSSLNSCPPTRAAPSKHSNTHTRTHSNKAMLKTVDEGKFIVSISDDSD